MAVTEELFQGSPVAGLGEEDEKGLVGGCEAPSDVMGRACLLKRGVRELKFGSIEIIMMGDGKMGICWAICGK